MRIWRCSLFHISFFFNNRNPWGAAKTLIINELLEVR